MTELLYKNNAQTTLAGSITNVAVTANLQAGAGVLFPSPGVGQGYYGTFTDAATGLLREIVLVTEMTGDTITAMVRGQQGTAAQSWAANDLFAKLWTAGDAEGAVQVDQAQAQAFNYALDTGSVNSYVATLDPDPGAPVTGMPFRVKIANTNTGASTLNSTTIRRRDNSNLIGGELIANDVVTFIYDGTRYRIDGVAPATSAAISAGTDTQSAVTPAQLASAVGSQRLLTGQARLGYVGATSIKLSPYNGNGVPVAGTLVQLPSSGVSAANTGVTVNGSGSANLANNTTYLVALAAGPVLEYWTVATGHSADSTAGNVGVEVITGHPTKTLVGMVSTDGSGQFSSLLTLSWFNQRGRVSKSHFTGDPTISSTGLVELDTSIRNSFLVWSGSEVAFSVSGSVNVNSSGQFGLTGIGFDGTTPEIESALYSGMHTSTEGSSVWGNGSFTGRKTGLSEGLHYATLLGNITASGTVTWQGDTTTISGGDPPPFQLEITFQG